MDRKTLRQIDKAVYIALVVLAAAAILIAMVTGPLGMDEISIGASVCACLIAVAISGIRCACSGRRTGNNSA